MLTRHRDKVRRIIMWAAGVVLTLSVAAWTVSLWGPCWAVWIGQERVDIIVWGGTAVWKSWGIRPTHVGGPGFSWAGITAPVWTWPPWPHSVIYPGPRRTVIVPIWPVILVSGVAFVGTYRIERCRRIWEREGRCLNCGYDLTGIDGVCPECGNKP